MVEQIEPLSLSKFKKRSDIYAPEMPVYELSYENINKV